MVDNDSFLLALEARLMLVEAGIGTLYRQVPTILVLNRKNPVCLVRIFDSVSGICLSVQVATISTISHSGVTRAGSEICPVK